MDEGEPAWTDEVMRGGYRAHGFNGCVDVGLLVRFDVKLCWGGGHSSELVAKGGGVSGVARGGRGTRFGWVQDGMCGWAAETRDNYGHHEVRCGGSEWWRS